MRNVGRDGASAADHANGFNDVVVVNLMPRIEQLKMQALKQQLFDLPHHDEAHLVIGAAARLLHGVQQINELVIDIGSAVAAKGDLRLAIGLLRGIGAGLVGGDADIAGLVGTVDARRVNELGKEGLNACHGRQCTQLAAKSHCYLTPF